MNHRMTAKILRAISALATAKTVKLRGKDSNLDYLIQSQASYH